MDIRYVHLVYPYIIQCLSLCVNPCNSNMVCGDPHQTRVHEVMGRPVRSFPCRSICLPRLPLAQHPQHAAEVLISASTAHTRGSFVSASATLQEQQSSDRRQHAWNANGLPSTMLHRTAYLGLGRVTQTFQFWFPWIPIGKSSLVLEAVGLPRYKPLQELSLLVRSCGIGHGLPANYQVFQLHNPLTMV